MSPATRRTLCVREIYDVVGLGCLHRRGRGRDRDRSQRIWRQVDVAVIYGTVVMGRSGDATKPLIAVQSWPRSPCPRRLQGLGRSTRFRGWQRRQWIDNEHPRRDNRIRLFLSDPTTSVSLRLYLRQGPTRSPSAGFRPALPSTPKPAKKFDADLDLLGSQAHLTACDLEEGRRAEAKDPWMLRSDGMRRRRVGREWRTSRLAWDSACGRRSTYSPAPSRHLHRGASIQAPMRPGTPSVATPLPRATSTPRRVA